MNENKNLKDSSVFIAMPCLGGVNPEVVDSVFKNMTSFTKKYAKDNEEITEKAEIRTIIGSLIYNARDTLVKTFLEETNKTHFFFWDSDIILFPDTINQLVELDKDVVSVVYYSKTAPHRPVFGAERVVVNEDKIGTKAIGNNAYLQEDLMEVWGVGLGGCLIKREVLEDMVMKYDNMFFPLKSLGEDYAFCERLYEQGYKVNIAPKIRTFHVGGAYYEVDDYEKQLRAYMAARMNEHVKKMQEEEDEGREDESSDS